MQQTVQKIPFAFTVDEINTLLLSLRKVSAPHEVTDPVIRSVTDQVNTYLAEKNGKGGDNVVELKPEAETPAA